MALSLGLIRIVQALTPIERLEATRRFDTSFVAEHWFLMATMTALTLLAGLLLWVSYNRVIHEKTVAEHLFFEQADNRGLSVRERQILIDVVGKSRLKRRDAIFTMQDAFDGGAARLLEQGLENQRPAEEADQLRAELSFLREKLGFQPTTSIGSAAGPKKLSSRQIPIGKTVHVTRRKARSSASIDAVVLKNDEIELAMKLAVPVHSMLGEYWRVRYYFGTSVLEFDTSVVNCAGDILVLNHSENVRFINRRRFLRVSVNRPAFIANFPFTRSLMQKANRSKKGSKVARASANGKARSWGAPEFVPGVVTELAGPGLRLEAPLQVNIGDRVLVILALNENEREYPDKAPPKGRKTVTSKIVQDIGMVRHTKAAENGLSIAVELVGLSDSDVDELIRATNAASPRKAAPGKKTPAGLDSRQAVQQELAESAAAKGV